MTLERHRSKLIPDVDFSAEGRLFVTDREGTFPLRHKGSKKAKEQQQARALKRYDAGDKSAVPKDSYEMREKEQPWEFDPDYRIFDDLSSYHSFDPARDRNRKYKPKHVSNYERAMRDIAGSVGSPESTSSLNRRLRRSRSSRVNREAEGRFGKTHSVGSTDSIRRFKRGQKPQMPPEMRQSLRRNHKRYRSLDINELRKAKRKETNNNFTSDYYNINGGGMNGHIPPPPMPLPNDPDFPILERQLSEEKLPRVILIVIGILLVLCGMVRLLLTRWHEYFHPFWTGGLLLLLGIISACHKGQYLHRSKNVAFIVVASLCSIATMISTALILKVLVPLTTEIALGTNESLLVHHIEFSRWSEMLVYKSMSPTTMVHLSLALDYATLVLSLIGFFSLTVMLVCIDNFIDASYHTTGECDHRGTPKFFNPLEQMSLSQATIFIGVVVMAIQTPNSNHYYSPSWAPLCMLLAAFVSIFYGKRPDLRSLGWLSSAMQLFAMLACGVTTVFMTLALVEGITEITAKDSDYITEELIVSACVHALFILLLIINIVFSVGVVFRHSRLMCCAHCFDDDDYVYDHYDKKEKYDDNYKF